MRSLPLLDGPISITFALIAANIAVSLVGFWALRRERYASAFLFIPYRAVRGQNWLGALLSHFAHGDLWHLLVNMLALFFFGPRVEQALGATPYVLVYAGSGLASTLVVLVLRFRNPRHSALGASGCVAGVVFAFVVLAPTATMLFPLAPVPLPAPLFALAYLVMSMLMMGRGDHVAHEAHIGGAVGGFALAGLLSEAGFEPFFRAVSELTT